MNIMNLLLVLFYLTTERFVDANFYSPLNPGPPYFHHGTCQRGQRKGRCTGAEDCHQRGGTIAGHCYLFNICCLDIEPLPSRPVNPSSHYGKCGNDLREGTCLGPEECLQRGGTISRNCFLFIVCCYIDPYSSDRNLQFRPTPHFGHKQPKYQILSRSKRAERSVAPDFDTIPIEIRIGMPRPKPGFIYEPVYNFPKNATWDMFSIPRGDPEVCQLRIDLVKFSVGKIDSEGKCSAGAVTFTGHQHHVMPPVLCGENHGQHMYLPFKFGIPISIRLEGITDKDEIKLETTRIKCDDEEKLAPKGCLQLFTEKKGTVKSFGYQNRIPKASETFQLANMNYKVCIGVENHFYAVKWKKDPAAPRSFFTISGDAEFVQNTLGDPTLGNIGENCVNDYVGILKGNFQIGGTWYLTSRFCGLGFPSQVTTSSTILQVVTNNVELADKDGGNAGVCLHYQAI